MADVIDPAGPAAGATDRDDHGGQAAAPVAAADPRAVRVRLSPASRLADEPALRIAPPAEPLRPTNPTTGVGPFGGAAAPAPAPGRETVLAQRQVEVDGVIAAVAVRSAGPGRWVLEEAGGQTRVVVETTVAADGGIRRREVLVDGFRFDVDVESERIAALRERASQGRAASAHSGPLEVHAIIPGRVVAVSVAPGDAVTAGQQLLVVEAMKMQNELRSPRDGTISRVGVAPGVTIEVGDLLVVIS
jgi:biotin carboxyl carrier protein